MRERLPRLLPVIAVVVLAAALAGSAPSASASTFTVCASGCDFPTITAANASASVHNGDELVVKPGTYTDAPVLTKVLAVYGEPSLPMPVLAPSGFGVTALSLGAGSEGSVVSHLKLAPDEPANGEGFYAGVEGTLSDAVIEAPRAFGINAAGTTLLNVNAIQTSALDRRPGPRSGRGHGRTSQRHRDLRRESDKQVVVRPARARLRRLGMRAGRDRGAQRHRARSRR